MLYILYISSHLLEIWKHQHENVWQIYQLLIRHCWSFTTKSWRSTTLLWSWFVANSMAAMCQCLVGKAWVVLQLATQERLFFVPATTVRTVTTLMTWVSSMKRVSNKGNKGLKRGKEVGRGRHNFLAKWSTAREEDVELTGVSNTVAFTHTVENRREGNAHGFSTFWVSGVVVFFL